MYRKRRCIVPIDVFFEWKAIQAQEAKQRYAIAMKDGVPFGIAGIWENWKEPALGEWIRTFAIITTDANNRSRDSRPRPGYINKSWRTPVPSGRAPRAQQRLRHSPSAAHR